MRNSQEHIINKVVIDVNTTSEKVAYGLKDNLDVFLKEEIFPYLEQYFKELEKELPSQIIQIPKLTLNVAGSEENNYENIKEEIKKQAKQELQNMITSPENKNGDVQFLSTSQSKQDTFFYFLEKGIAPWWKKTEDHLFFNENDLIEMSKTKSFKNRFEKSMQITRIQDRLINQFSNAEMKSLFCNVFKEEAINNEVVEKMKHLLSFERRQIWQCLIRYFLEGDARQLESGLITIFSKRKQGQAGGDDEDSFVEMIKLILKQVHGGATERLNDLLKTIGKGRLPKEEQDGLQGNLNEEEQEKGKVSNIETKDLESQKGQASKESQKYDEDNNSLFEKGKKKISNAEKQEEDAEIIKKENSEKVNRQLEEEDNLIQEVLQDGTREKHKEIDEKGEYHIENAGLIILHPYLKDFFANCGLLDENNDVLNPELAIHLLHYLATKKEQQFESNMVFEKFLCGIAIEQSIRREVVIPEIMKQKADDLLEAIVLHWGALNNASTDLLRNEFLQRSGKLSFKTENPKIIIERKVHDILLDRLPWTLGLCKLPWINKLIFTDW